MTLALTFIYLLSLKIPHFVYTVEPALDTYLCHNTKVVKRYILQIVGNLEKF